MTPPLPLSRTATATVAVAMQNLTSTPLPFTAIQPPQWDPATVYGIVFGIVTGLLAIPGAWIAVCALRKHCQVDSCLSATYELICLSLVNGG